MHLILNQMQALDNFVLGITISIDFEQDLYRELTNKAPVQHDRLLLLGS